MDKKISIKSIILDKDNKDTEVYRDILLWTVRMDDKEDMFPDYDEMEKCLRQIRMKFTEKDKSNISKSYVLFRFTDIGKWLIEHHRPFIEEYRQSNITKSYRVYSKRTYIQSRINDLIELHLIEEKGRVKSEKNNTYTPVYCFTEQGFYFAWLTEALYSKEKFSFLKATMVVYDIIMMDLFSRTSFVVTFIVIFLQKCNNRDLFDQFIKQHLFLLIEKFPFDVNFSFLMQYFSFHANTTKDEIARIFIETISELDKDIQKMVLFQFKLDIESRFEGILTEVEWEKMRHDNIHDYTKVTLQGYCKNCGSYPFQLDIFEFLKLPFIFTLPLGPVHEYEFFQRINCIKCHERNGLQIFSTWMNQEDKKSFLMFLSNEQIENIKARK